MILQAVQAHVALAGTTTVLASLAQAGQALVAVAQALAGIQVLAQATAVRLARGIKHV